MDRRVIATWVAQRETDTVEQEARIEILQATVLSIKKRTGDKKPEGVEGCYGIILRNAGQENIAGLHRRRHCPSSRQG
jgi:hypothetical protein